MHDERVNCEIVYGTGLSFIPDIFDYVQYYGLLPSITDAMEDSLPSRSLYELILRFLLAMTNLFLQVRKENYRRAEAKIISLYGCEVSNTATPPG